MRRSLLVLSVLAAVVLAARWRHPAAPDNKAALALAILKDVAHTDGEGISWRTYGTADNATLWQHQRADFQGGVSNAVVETESWQLELSLSKVFGVSCHVTGGDHGYPEYGFISFMAEDGDVFDALFSVGFDGSRIDALQRLCDKHGIPVDR